MLILDAGELVFQQKIQRASGREIAHREPGVGAKKEGDALQMILLLGEPFAFAHGMTYGIDLREVGGGVGSILPAGGLHPVLVLIDGRDCGGTEAEVTTTFPVAQIMLREVARVPVV